MSEDNGKLHIVGPGAVVVHALLRKRRDVAFQAEAAEREAEAHRADLIHLDAVIRMFAPDVAPDALPARERRIRRLYFAHGEITRRIFDMLRPGGSVQALDIAKPALAEKGFSLADKYVRTEFCRRITMQLNALRKERRVERIGYGRGARWRLAPAEQSE